MGIASEGLKESVLDLMMNGQLSTYVIQTEYGKAMDLLRTALREEGLDVPMEMDVSGYLRKQLSISLRPCRVLCVSSPSLLLHAVVVDALAAALLPVQVVVWDHGPNTLVRLTHPADDAALPAGLRGPAAKLRARFSKALERLGARPAVYELSL